MRKLTFCLLFISSLSFGQFFQKNDKDLNVGLKMGRGLGASASYDLAVTNDLSLGAVVALRSRWSSYPASLAIGGRLAYHFGKSFEKIDLDMSKSDPYIGFSLGYVGYSANDYLNDLNRTFFNPFLGYRHGIKNNLGIFVEFGYPSSALGINIKM